MLLASVLNYAIGLYYDENNCAYIAVGEIDFKQYAEQLTIQITILTHLELMIDANLLSNEQLQSTDQHISALREYLEVSLNLIRRFKETI